MQLVRIEGHGMDIRETEALLDSFALEALEEAAWKRRRYTSFCLRVYGIYALIALHFEARDFTGGWLGLGIMMTLCLIVSWSFYLRTLVHVVRGTYGAASDEAHELVRLIRRWQEEQSLALPPEAERELAVGRIKMALAHARYRPDSS